MVWLVAACKYTCQQHINCTGCCQGEKGRDGLDVEMHSSVGEELLGMVGRLQEFSEKAIVRMVW